MRLLHKGKAIIMSPKWKHAKIAKFSFANLKAIIRNEIPAAIINNFATLEESNKFSSAVLNMKAKEYQFGKPGFYLGNPLTHYRDLPKEEYFEAVAAAENERKEVIKYAFDPIARFMQIISQQTEFNISIAEEPDGTQYFAGIIRIIAGGSDLHVDYAPTFARGNLSVGDISAQLAWNYYPSVPTKGGETVIYNRPFEFSGIEKTYSAYDRKLLDGCESLSFKPNIGSVVIFNTSNPHIVLPSAAGSKGHRIATGSFIGLLGDHNLVLWS